MVGGGGSGLKAKKQRLAVRDHEKTSTMTKCSGMFSSSVSNSICQVNVQDREEIKRKPDPKKTKRKKEFMSEKCWLVIMQLSKRKCNPIG